MCSIIGYRGKNSAAPILVNGLQRMEYRGYDSVGIATKSKNQILLRKGIGKVVEVNNSKARELIWFLEHPSVYTAGSSFNKNDILDDSINLIKTKRGGKITWHGPGQLVCYFVINLNNRKRDIRNFISLIENSIIESLKEYKIKSQSDKKI